jgi:hypothetical protein
MGRRPRRGTLDEQEVGVWGSRLSGKKRGRARGMQSGASGKLNDGEGRLTGFNAKNGKIAGKRPGYFFHALFQVLLRRCRAAVAVGKSPMNAAAGCPAANPRVCARRIFAARSVVGEMEHERIENTTTVNHEDTEKKRLAFFLALPTNYNTHDLQLFPAGYDVVETSPPFPAGPWAFRE